MERSAMEEGAGVEVQDEDRRVGRGGVDLVERRHAPFGELELGPAADHANPLRRGRVLRLCLQHAECIGERGYAFPPQLHVVVEPATDEVRVARSEAHTSELQSLMCISYA